MKKGFITLLFVFFCFAVHAQNCPTKPTCLELGYLYTENDCLGQKMIKCPLDKSQVFCRKTRETQGYSGKKCSVGDIFSVTYRRCTSEKDYPADYIFIEDFQTKSSLVAILLQQQESSLKHGSFDDTEKTTPWGNEKMITKLQLQKILRYFLLHYEYRCILTKEGLVYVDETTGKLKNITSEEDFGLCLNGSSLGSYYNLRTVRLNYRPS